MKRRHKLAAGLLLAWLLLTSGIVLSWEVGRAIRRHMK